MARRKLTARQQVSALRETKKWPVVRAILSAIGDRKCASAENCASAEKVVAIGVACLYPPCCVAFFVGDWHAWYHAREQTADHDVYGLLVERSPVRWPYIPCPRCLVRGVPADVFTLAEAGLE